MNKFGWQRWIIQDGLDYQKRILDNLSAYYM